MAYIYWVSSDIFYFIGLEVYKLVPKGSCYCAEVITLKSCLPEQLKTMLKQARDSGLAKKIIKKNKNGKSKDLVILISMRMDHVILDLMELLYLQLQASDALGHLEITKKQLQGSKVSTKTLLS